MMVARALEAVQRARLDRLAAGRRRAETDGGAVRHRTRTDTGCPLDERRSVCQAKAWPIQDELAAFLDARLARIPGKGELAKAIRYACSHRAALTRHA
ncbi:transposase [Azospirillum sp. RWY-5-1]|uniref:Transposase n=1 Tax=Azospirillum oleiclasticum TaxID=2735135 RepID=A0ABX2TM92_9PROT|nr:transposase [Azospirillum oleiclasticum]NYZ24363.1 transposase [Azospirillum oleiclasticum]